MAVTHGTGILVFKTCTGYADVVFVDVAFEEMIFIKELGNYCT